MLAGDDDLYVGQHFVKNPHGLGEPLHLDPGQEAHHKRRFHRMSGSPRRFAGRLDLR
jgi:hypothetical protein